MFEVCDIVCHLHWESVNKDISLAILAYVLFIFLGYIVMKD